MLLGRIGLGRAEALGESDKHHTDAGAEQVDEAVEADAGKPKRRQSAVDMTDDRDAVALETEGVHGKDAHDHDHQRSRNRGRGTAQKDQQRQR